jgi:hypothetical protein
MGIVLIMGDSQDQDAIKAARTAWVKAASADAKAIDARWRQRVISEKAAGNQIPVMPKNVEDAQDFIAKYRSGFEEVGRRFLVTIDGRTFDTKDQCERHIKSRYTNDAANWESFVNDTFMKLAKDDDDPEAVEMLRKQASKKAKKEDKEAKEEVEPNVN